MKNIPRKGRGQDHVTHFRILHHIARDIKFCIREAPAPAAGTGGLAPCRIIAPPERTGVGTGSTDPAAVNNLTNTVVNN